MLAETERRPGRFDLPGAATSTAGMTALVYGFVRAAESGWGDALTVASFAAAAVLLAAFVVIERRAPQPVTPLRLFASRRRVGAYVARMLVVGGMFSMFFFLSQYLQGVRGFSPLQAGVAFLPMTAVMFSMVRFVPRLATRWGDARLLVGGPVGRARGHGVAEPDSVGTAYFPGIALPLALLGIGMGVAIAPLTAAGIAGVAPADAGAASGVRQRRPAARRLARPRHPRDGLRRGEPQRGGSPSPGWRSRGPPRARARGRVSLAGSAVFLALALAVAVVVIRRPGPVARARLRPRSD